MCFNFVSFQVEFEGIIGSSFESDMAIDDLVIYEVRNLDSKTCAFAPSVAIPASPSARPSHTPSAPVSPGCSNVGA